VKKLYVVATPIGNLDDFSKRAIDTLNNVDVILCEDTRHSLKLLNHYNIKKHLISYHKFNEIEKSKELIKMLEEKDLALISDAGTPLISDPGYAITKLARENNIEVIGIPGPSALITALSISGFEINNFSYYGFFPRENKDKNNLIEKIKNSDIELFVFYESPKRIIKTIEYIKEKLISCEILVCSDLTKLHEKHYYGEITKVLEELKNNEKSNLGEYTLIIKKTKEYTIEKETLSIEAQLINLIIKENITLKDAINKLSETNKISKKEVYNASLNLKNLI